MSMAAHLTGSLSKNKKQGEKKESCDSLSVWMAQVHEFKTFLYAFCGKRKVQPSYIVEEEDSGFYCEVKKNCLLS